MISFEGQKSNQLIQQIQQHEQEPVALKGLFSTSEIQWLRKIKDDAFALKDHTSEKLVTSERGPLGKMAHPQGQAAKDIEELVREKIKDRTEGNFTMSFTFHRNFFPYGTHTDAAYNSDEFLYKQGIIPLEIYPSDAEVYTVIFRQKAYHPISYPGNVETIKALKEEELATIHGLDSELKITDEELRRYWQGPSDKERFRGFEIALPFQWILGDMALWDRAHLHCSSDFKNHGIDGKVGLMWVSRKI